MAITAFLTRFIPFSAFFRNVNTLVHELGHALVTLILSGNVMYINLYADQSGVTYSSYTANWKLIPISLAGYMGAALFALLLFYLHTRKKERAGLVVVTLLAVLSLMLFVRNDYGMIWCGGFAVLTIVICTIAPTWLRNSYYLLIAFLCLVESVISSFVILVLALQDAKSAGDAANLTEVTYVPAIFWGLLFTVFSLWCAKAAIKLMFTEGYFSGRVSLTQR
jgi:hypothetical protein